MADLQAHHVEPWAASPALRYEVANGLTLCRPCHENIHGAKIPRASQRFQPQCAECGRATKGRSRYCKPCGMRLSPKAAAQRAARRRNANGQFAA